MRLRVLGNTGRYLAPLSGGSSYLVEAEGTHVLLDCGGGAAEAYARAGAPPLAALVLSHFHHDHVLDLIRLRDVLDARATVFVPHGETARLQELAEAFAFRGPFELESPVVEPPWGRAFEAGPLTLRFEPTHHSAPSMGTRLEHRGRSLAYASDTTPCEGLLRLAGGCDLLLMHTLLPDVDPTSDHAQRHSTARTAAGFAAAAGAGKLLLSHRYHKSEDKEMLAAAKAMPATELARDDATYEI